MLLHVSRRSLIDDLPVAETPTEDGGVLIVEIWAARSLPVRSPGTPNQHTSLLKPLLTYLSTPRFKRGVLVEWPDHCSPGPHINIPAWVSCMSWCANCEFRGSAAECKERRAAGRGCDRFDEQRGMHAALEPWVRATLRRMPRLIELHMGM